MRTRHLAAPFVLLYWQLGPMPRPATDTDGSVHWSVSGMASSGQWEDAQFDCDGNLTSSEAVPYHDIGGKVDIEVPSNGLRFTVAASSNRLPANNFSVGSPSVMTYGGMIAWEGRRTGAGVGVVQDRGAPAVPSFYLRLGRREHAHFRMEVEPLSELRTLAGVFRTGVGFKQGFVGISYSSYYARFSQTTLFGDVNIPVMRGLDLRLAGNIGPGVQTFQWGVGAGLRLHR